MSATTISSAATHPAVLPLAQMLCTLADRLRRFAQLSMSISYLRLGRATAHQGMKTAAAWQSYLAHLLEALQRVSAAMTGADSLAAQHRQLCGLAAVADALQSHDLAAMLDPGGDQQCPAGCDIFESGPYAGSQNCYLLCRCKPTPTAAAAAAAAAGTACMAGSVAGCRRCSGALRRRDCTPACLPGGCCGRLAPTPAGGWSAAGLPRCK